MLTWERYSGDPGDVHVARGSRLTYVTARHRDGGYYLTWYESSADRARPRSATASASAANMTCVLSPGQGRELAQGREDGTWSPSPGHAAGKPEAPALSGLPEELDGRTWVQLAAALSAAMRVLEPMTDSSRDACVALDEIDSILSDDRDGPEGRVPGQPASPGGQQGPAVHHAEDPAPMRDGYQYNAAGEGVRGDLISAVLAAWARISPDGDPAGPLRSVNDGYLNRVENLARIAALAVALTLEGHRAGK